MKQLKILLWFLVRPRYWQYFLYFVSWRLRNLRESHNTAEERAAASAWCEQNAVDRSAALKQIIGTADIPSFEETYQDLLKTAMEVVSQTTIPMGGGSDMELIYQAAEHVQATRVIETGVAFGWSSLAFLLSLRHRPGSRLVSTDLAYPRGNSEQYVGCVVPPDLRHLWTLIPYPDRQALPKALKQLPEIDVCHYDSDKSYEGRLWAYPRLWKALRSGGIFISDDIGDNLGFRDFCALAGQKPIIFKYKTRYIGVLVKPPSS